MFRESKRRRKNISHTSKVMTIWATASSLFSHRIFSGVFPLCVRLMESRKQRFTWFGQAVLLRRNELMGYFKFSKMGRRSVGSIFYSYTDLSKARLVSLILLRLGVDVGP